MASSPSQKALTIIPNHLTGNVMQLYDICIPPLVHALNNLSKNLTKGESYANNKKFDPAVLVQSRLIADMYPLVNQVQIATDMSKGAAARLSGIDIPQYADDEKTFADCQARIDKTLAFLNSVKPEQFAGAEDRNIHLKIRDRVDVHFNGLEYVLKWVMPNVYFHCTTAYNIMRKNGVPLAKRDFLHLKD